MPYGHQYCFSDTVTDTYASSTALPTGYEVGMVREHNGNKYMFQQAGAAIAANEPVALDTSVTTGKKVVKTPAATDATLFGVANTALSNGYYGWITIESKSTDCIVANGVAAADPLGPSGTAGVLAKPANTVVAGLRVQALEANSSGSAAAKKVALLPC